MAEGDEEDTFSEGVLPRVEFVCTDELLAQGASPLEVDDVCSCVVAYVAIYFRELGLDVLAEIDVAGFDQFIRRLAVYTWLVGLYLSKLLVEDDGRALTREQIGRRTLAERLERADLSSDQRRLVVLMFEIGLTLDQSAQILGLPLDDAREMLRAARVIAAMTDVLMPPSFGDAWQRRTPRRRHRRERRR